jgi:hypothetical protein
VKTKERAQAVLEKFLPQYNRRFSKPPAEALPLWQKVAARRLEQSLCFKYQRTVAKDNTVQFSGALFQIPRPSPHRSYANKRIELHVLLDGAVELFFKEERIACFDSKTTPSIGLYRNNGRWEVSRYGPETTQPVHHLLP